MPRRKVSNPLALAVLACLAERPMHPYEMSTTMRERGKHESIKLNYGSLYSVVEALQKHALIAPRETVKDGRRPERTVYEITSPGRLEFVDWLAELIGTPAKEYQSFEAGLSLLGGLDPDTAFRLLEQRGPVLRCQLHGGQEMQRYAANLESRASAAPLPSRSKRRSRQLRCRRRQLHQRRRPSKQPRRPPL